MDYNTGEPDRDFFAEAGLLSRQEIIKKVGAIVEFEVKSKDGQKQIFTADMKVRWLLLSLNM